MLNWQLLSPRNLVVIAVIAVSSIIGYNYFHKKIGGQ